MSVFRVRPAATTGRWPIAPVTYGRLLTSPFRVLPDFVIVGAQRCGTTSLYHTLIRHPQIGAATTKEVHFFDNHHDRGSLWYRAHFPTMFERQRSERAGTRLLAGEASPYYLFHPHAPARLKAAMPNAKLIVILRNPTARAYSHYQHAVKKGYEPLSFVQAIDMEEERLSGEIERMLADPSYRSFAHQRWSYVSRGVYIDQLNAWSRLFPRDQLLVLHLAELCERPALTWTRVFNFLGIDEYDFGESERWSVGRYGGLESGIRKMLEERFRPHNARLYDWLGEDLGWDGSLR